MQKANSIIDDVEDPYDPIWVNSAAYERAIDIQMAAFEKAFDKDLDQGGWGQINQAHFALIEEALDQHVNKNKRILITFGAGHIAWLRRALMNRNDIELKDIIEIL